MKFMLLIIVVLSVITVSAQSGETERSFSSVEASQRQGLNDAFSAFLETHRKQDWATLYDMFPPGYLKYTKTRFLEIVNRLKPERDHNNVVDFIVTEIDSRKWR